MSLCCRYNLNEMILCLLHIYSNIFYGIIFNDISMLCKKKKVCQIIEKAYLCNANPKNQEYMFIKCELSETDDIAALIKRGVRMIGLNFNSNMSDCLKMINSQTGIFPDYPARQFADSISQLSEMCGQYQLVGMFADEMPQTIITRIHNYNLDFVQLDGDESRVMIENLKRSVLPDIASTLGVIKTVIVDEQTFTDVCRKYEGVVDYFLFKPDDGVCDTDWFEMVMENYEGNTPYIISGVNSTDDLEIMVQNKKDERLVGIDVGKGCPTGG